MADNRAIVYFDDDRNKFVFRASGLGMACDTAKVAAGLGLPGEPPPDWLMEKFAEGSAAEDFILRRAKSAGVDDEQFKEHGLFGIKKFKLLDPKDSKAYDGLPHCKLEFLDDNQFTMEIPVGAKVLIRGHMDGIGQVYQCVKSDVEMPFTNGDRVTLEAKALGEDGYKKFERNGLRDFPYYAYQVAIYIIATGLPVLFIVACKNDDGTVTDDSPIQYVLYTVDDLGGELPTKAEIFKRVLGIVKRIENEDLPEFCSELNQYPCPYYLSLHPDEKVDKKTVTVEVDDELKDLALDYHMAKSVERETKVTLNGKRATKTAPAIVGIKQMLMEKLESIGVVPGQNVEVECDGVTLKVEMVEREIKEFVSPARTDRYPQVKVVDGE